MDDFSRMLSKSVLDEARYLLRYTLVEDDLPELRPRIPYYTSQIVDQTLGERQLGFSTARKTQDDVSELLQQNKLLCAHIRRLQERLAASKEELSLACSEKIQLAREVEILRDDKLVLRAKLDGNDELHKQVYLLKAAVKRLERENALLRGIEDAYPLQNRIADEKDVPGLEKETKFQGLAEMEQKVAEMHAYLEKLKAGSDVLLESSMGIKSQLAEMRRSVK